MAVYKSKIFNNKSIGASMIEVILAISIIAVAAPFMYKQIERTYSDIENISVAQKIVDMQDAVLNFVRLHQEDWPDEAEIKMSDADIKKISPAIVSVYQILRCVRIKLRVKLVAWRRLLVMMELRMVMVGRHRHPISSLEI